MPIQWSEICLVDNTQIDQQHEEWVIIFNRLEEHVLSSNLHLHDEQVEVLRRLLELTATHFKDEEDLLEEFNYPNKVSHKRMHKEFNQRVYELYREAKRGDQVLNSTILAMVKNWFITHTTTEDKKAFTFIQQQKKSESS